MGTHELRSDKDIEEILTMAFEESPSGEKGDMRARLMACAADLDLTPEQVAAAEERWVKRETERVELADYKAWLVRRFWRRSVMSSFVGIVLAKPLGAVSAFGLVFTVGAIIAVSLALNAWRTFWPGQTRSEARFAAWKLYRNSRRPPLE